MEITIADRSVRFARATRLPDFRERRIIASTPWEFVSLWLRNKGLGDAEIYWRQARNFLKPPEAYRPKPHLFRSTTPF